MPQGSKENLTPRGCEEGWGRRFCVAIETRRKSRWSSRKAKGEKGSKKNWFNTVYFEVANQLVEDLNHQQDYPLQYPSSQRHSSFHLKSKMTALLETKCLAQCSQMTSPVLQYVGGMRGEYTRTTLSGISSTFFGLHPCTKCTRWGLTHQPSHTVSHHGNELPSKHGKSRRTWGVGS